MNSLDLKILIIALKALDLKALDGKLDRKDFCIMGSEDEDSCIGCIKFDTTQRAIKIAKSIKK